jgi:hypothetical protein
MCERSWIDPERQLLQRCRRQMPAADPDIQPIISSAVSKNPQNVVASRERTFLRQ